MHMYVTLSIEIRGKNIQQALYTYQPGQVPTHMQAYVRKSFIHLRYLSAYLPISV